MCGGYRDRWKYLYHVYLRQKKKVPAFFAFIAATVAACFTGMFYKGLQLVAATEATINRFKYSAR